MQPFLALITPLASGAHPDNTLPTPQPPIDPGYSPPWARPRPPGGPVDPGYSPPWATAPVDPGYGIPVGGRPHPSHPIYYPGAPVDPGYGIPEGGAPHPSHPIYIPAPPTEPPSPPLVIWGGPYFPPEPTHPIELPPEVVPPPVEGQPKIEWKTAWTPQTGWIVVGIPAEGTLVPTPAKKA